MNRIPLPDRLRDLMTMLATAGMHLALGQLRQARRDLRIATHQLKALRIAAGDKPLARRGRRRRT